MASHPAPIVVGDITAQVMPARGQDKHHRWYWRARRSGASQAYVWTGRGHPEDVLRHLASMVAGGVQPQAVQVQAAPVVTVAQALDAWWSTAVDGSDLAVRSQEVYACRCRALAGSIGHVAVAQLDARHIEAHRAARTRARKAGRTVRHEVVTLLSAWRWWRDLGWIQAAPPPMPAIRVRDAESRTPTLAEVLRLLAEPPDAVRQARDALYRRLGRIASAAEFAALEHRDVEVGLQAGVVHLGRGGDKPRSLPIHGELVDLLRAIHRPGSTDLLLGHYAPDMVRDVLLVQLAVGGRIGEVAALHHGDVEVDGASGWLHLGRHERAEKTGRRSVPIRGRVLEIVAARLQPGAEGTIWGCRLLTVLTRVSRWWRSIPWERLRLERWTPHGHRRLAADRVLRGGAEVAAAAALLGHDAKTMWAHYRRVTSADVERAARLGGMGDLEPSNVVSLEARRREG